MQCSVMQFPVRFECQQHDSKVWPSYSAQSSKREKRTIYVSHISWQIHTGCRVNTHIPYQRQTLHCLMVQVGPCGVQSIINSKTGTFQIIQISITNYTNMYNFLLNFFITFLCPFKYSGMIKNPPSFRGFWCFETKREWKKIYFLALNLKA